MSSRRLPNIRKILIIRNDGIGDLLNSTPAIALLRQNYPDAEITVLAQPLNAPILIGNPDVDRIRVFDREGEHRRLWARFRFYRSLRREKYDLVVAMRTASWPNFVAFLSGAPYRLGRYHKRFKCTLTHTWRGMYEKGHVHEVDRNFDLVRLVCEGKGHRRLVLNLLDDELAKAKGQLAAWGIAPQDFLVGIHPGGSSFDKRWPERNYARVADTLVNEHGAKVLILRGPEEAELERNLQKAMRADSIAFAPKSIRELAALINVCNLFVCNDSGPMHIAAALDVPTVAIFGPTDHVAWKPLSDEATLVRRDMPCWPCSAHKCKIGWECTKKLPVDAVWGQVEKRAKTAPQHRKEKRRVR
ncbi:MAG: lipopolysaccharide heptosyltransferase II [Candidatus Poribacteria bacterium]|nr:lipopolysaccharide heptosyltransferase II [Candidatus Poribacteria bacterium]